MVDAAPQVAKIKLKVNSMELEYEGDPSFLIGGIEALLVTMGELSKHKSAETKPEIEAVNPLASQTSAKAEDTGKSPAQVSTNTIAAHLEVKSCSELVISALAQLEVLQGNSAVAKSDLVKEMKAATSYYNANMRGGNLTQAFKTLVKNKRVNQLPGDKYALAANERKQIEAKLADIG